MHRRSPRGWSSSAACPATSRCACSRTPTRGALADVLRERRRRDIERAATGAGPHLDDVELRESGRDLRRFGSQGEQRRALLALILAEADLLTAERGEQPVLLLDDVTGEFDAERRGLLLEAVARFDQAIVTTTDEADLGPGVARVVRVDGGTGAGVSDLERIRTDAVIGRRAPAPDPVLAAVRERWPAVVGETVARHAVPARITAGALVVACSSSAWSSELSLLAPTVAARLQAELGRELELRFEVGDVPAPAEPARASPCRRPSRGLRRRPRRLAATVGSDALRASLERAIARTLRG